MGKPLTDGGPRPGIVRVSRRSSATGFICAAQKIRRFRFEFAVNLVAVGMIVGKGRIDLGQADMRILLADLFRRVWTAKALIRKRCSRASSTRWSRISIGQRRRSVSLPPALDPLAARGQPEPIDTPADAPAGHLPRRRDRDEAAPGRGEVDPGVTLPASRTPSRPASRYR